MLICVTVPEEVLEAMAQAEADEGGVDSDRPFFQQWNCIFGFVAQVRRPHSNYESF